LAFGVAVVALPAAVASPAGATVTFGANLSQLADLSFHCNVPPPFFGPYRPPSPYAFPDTCTAFTSGNFGGGGVGSHLVPNGNGVITKIRIKEPPTTYDSASLSTFGPAGPLGQSGPLKVSVLEAIRTPQSSVAVCCRVVRESGSFTPIMRPFVDTITEVTFNPPLPVHEIVTSTGVLEFDAIAISAVSANSVIPAGRSNTASSGGYYPAVVPGQERYEQQTSFGSPGTQILMQADWEPVGATLAPITIGQGSAQVNRGSTAIKLRCNQTTRCIGLLKLQNKQGGRAAEAAAATTYGTGKINIPAGQSRNVKVQLSAAGRTLLRKHKRATVYAIVTFGARRVASVSIQLKR
jgi:hypothetical protein